jgi:branched-chain amino acid aminotransferase
VDTWVWIDGAVTMAGLARVDATDRGFLLGDGVFETCLAIGGRPFALTRHLARLRAGAKRLGLHLPWDDHTIARACDQVCEAARAGAAGGPGADRLRVRITVSAGPGPLGPDRTHARPQLVVIAGPAPVYPPTVDVVTMARAVDEASPLVGVKTTSRAESVVRLAMARQAGADEAILSNMADALCEGTGSNVFVTVGGRLATPSLRTGCLAGVTRALVCEVVEVVERDDLTLDDLRTSPEAFLTSTTRGVTAIAHVDGQLLRSSPGPLTMAASRALDDLQARTIEP